MTHEFLPQFRRRLFGWLQYRLEHGRTPFRRVEELPAVLTGERLATPDLVLWINRDSLLAGATIFIPPKVDTIQLLEAEQVAVALGLRQFVTWEAREVTVWELGPATPRRLRNWQISHAASVSVDDFAVVFEQLFRELKTLAVSAALPAGQLPPAYFANLCRQVLRDSESALQETSRVAAAIGQPDPLTRQSARDKGWLTLWRLLALMWHERVPPGIRPERLDRAIGYALAGLDQELGRHLAPASGEPSLAESAAIRFHHLAGRLAQLGWQHASIRAQASLTRLFTEATREYRVETALLDPPPSRQVLLVNHIPAQPLAETFLVAPKPCLAGAALLANTTGSPLPLQMVAEIPALPAGLRWQRVVATLLDGQALPAAQRRQRRTALRQPWPYRRFELPNNAPAWLWDALHLGGLVDPDGQLQLTIPGTWAEAPGATQLWRALSERHTLIELTLHADGRQTLNLVGHERTADCLNIRYPDGTQQQRPLLLDDNDLTAAMALTMTAPAPPAGVRKSPPGKAPLAEEIAARVFCDGLPCFPEHYLRRFNLPPVRSYQIHGPLQITSLFFDRIRLTGADGSVVECDNPADAEALLLAARAGSRQIDLPIDQQLTLRLIADYRNDLQHLWQRLIDECRRQHPTQRAALGLARRLWRERELPAADHG